MTTTFLASYIDASPFVKRVKGSGNWELLTDVLRGEKRKLDDTYDEPGIYIYALERRNNVIPIYVGKTLKRLKERVLNKQHLQSEFIVGIQKNKIKEGVPRIYCIIKQYKGRTASKKIPHIEDFLIGLAWAKNENIMNSRKIPPNKQNWEIRGVIPHRHGNNKPWEKNLKIAIGLRQASNLKKRRLRANKT